MNNLWVSCCHRELIRFFAGADDNGTAAQLHTSLTRPRNVTHTNIAMQHVYRVHHSPHRRNMFFIELLKGTSLTQKIPPANITTFLRRTCTVESLTCDDIQNLARTALSVACSGVVFTRCAAGLCHFNSTRHAHLN